MDLGGSSLHSGIMKGVGAYEQGRDRVMGGYNKVEALQSRIRKAVPEIEM